MSFFRTDDPIADYNAYDREQSAKLDRLPVCSDCDNPIQGVYFYINGECICEDCIEDYKRNTEDLMD